MELWIRSQDKEDLVKCKNIGLAYLGKYGFIDKIGDIERKKFYICEFTDTTHTTLGKYKTKERALEVLDEIENILKPIYQVKNEFKKSELTGNYKWETTQEYIPITCKIYEMPEE